MAEQKPLTLVLAGTPIPMRPQTSKHGNVYFAVLVHDEQGNRYSSPYGVEITPLADELPRLAMVEGVPVMLEPVDDDQRRVRGDGLVEVEGEPYRVRVGVTLRRNENWQLTAVAHKAPSRDLGGSTKPGPLSPEDL